MTARWRGADASDLDGMLAVQARVHTLVQERREVFADKLSLFPEGCLVLADADGRCQGYGLTHPWLLGEAPPLDALLDGVPEGADCLFIHDVALLPEARGQGAARAYVDHVARAARRRARPALALVSVYGTVPVWTRCGFTVTDAPGLAATLAGYGPTARYMTSDLG